MTQQGLQLDMEQLCCSACLDLLKIPVTIPCGHSFCMTCIKDHWDQEDLKSIYSCPQCRETFEPRPVLGKNTVLSELVEEMMKVRVRAEDSAVPAEATCDYCTGRKRKAVKSCLQCLVSYCELHLQPHHDSPTLQNHKLVEASANLHDIICSQHHKVKELFCRSDQQCICCLCSLEEHQGHDTISAVAERSVRQQDVASSWQRIKLRIQAVEKDQALLQEEQESLNAAADQAAGDSQASFGRLLQLMNERGAEVQQQIRSQQETESARVVALQQKLQRQMSELRMTEAKLEQLSQTEDHNLFLLRYGSLALPEPCTDRAAIEARPQTYFQELTAAVSEATQHLQDGLRREWPRVALTQVDVLLTQPATLPPARAVLSRRKSSLFSLSSSSTQQETTPTSQTPPEPETAPSSTVSLKRQAFEMSPSTVSTPSSSKVPLTQQAAPSSMVLSTHQGCGSPSSTVSTPRRFDTLRLPPAYVESEEFQAPPVPPVYAQTRANFLPYSCHVTLDPNTVNKHLVLSNENRKASRVKKTQLYLLHADRFADRFQVLSREGLTGRCYWEVQWYGIVSVAVTYKSIKRTGSISGFGDNDKSWALYCHNNKFLHRSESATLSGPQSPTVGVYLDHRAGVLALYRVSEPMVLLHRVQTVFTHPLHVGLCVVSGSAELVRLL